MTHIGFLKKAALRGLLCAFLFAAAATGIGTLFRLWQFPETNIVVVYILSVVLTARCTDGYFWGILSTVLSTCAFNAFFTAPYFTLSVEDPTYFITFAIMAMTSVITSALTSKAKKMTAEAVRNEQEASALYHLTSHLTDAESVEDIARIAVQTISDTMGCHAACLCFDGQELHVTPMEYSLLSLLFRNMGKVLTTQYIIRELYGPGYGNDTQALRALMAGLRRKIEKSPAKPRYILTEIGVGYRLVDE